MSACLRALLCLTATVVSMISASTFAVPESQLIAFDKSTLESFYSQGEIIDFVGAKSLSLRGRAFSGPKSESVVVIVPGWTEPARKYAEVIWDLNQLGYSVFIMDHRGQGESGRPIQCGVCSYVESYEYYVSDLAKFVKDEVKPRGPWKKVIMLAHSMGGGITTAMLQQTPSLADAAILLSPMEQIDTDPYSGPVAQSLIAAAVLAGKGKERRVLDKPVADTFENNISTHSEIRWSVSHQIGIDFPALYVDYATNGWLHQVFIMTDVIRYSLKKLPMPTLLLQADEDKYVTNPPHVKLCGYWPNCRLYTVKGAKHAILEETDPLRNEAFAQIAAFLKQQTR